MAVGELIVPTPCLMPTTRPDSFSEQGTTDETNAANLAPACNSTQPHQPIKQPPLWGCGSSRLLGCEVEVHAFLHLLDVDRLLLRPVRQDQLLQVQKRPPVRHLLPELDGRLPGVGCLGALAGPALDVDDDEADDGHLLEDGAGVDIRLHRELDLDAPRVRLGPGRPGSQGEPGGRLQAQRVGGRTR